MSVPVVMIGTCCQKPALSPRTAGALHDMFRAAYEALAQEQRNERVQGLAAMMREHDAHERWITQEGK